MENISIIDETAEKVFEVIKEKELTFKEAKQVLIRVSSKIQKIQSETKILQAIESNKEYSITSKIDARKVSHSVVEAIHDR